MTTRQARQTAGAATVYECTRSLEIEAAADTVWGWMADARRLLGLNPFHEAVAYPEPAQQVGLCIPIPHRIWGLYRQTRIARIHTYRTYCVAWGELQEHGFDRFPHSQSFTVVPLQGSVAASSIACAGSCVFPERGTGSCRAIASLRRVSWTTRTGVLPQPSRPRTVDHNIPSPAWCGGG